MRKPIIAGNWKMNLTPSKGVELVKALAPLVTDAKCDVVVCPPFVDLYAVSEAIKGTNIALGAQNINENDKGAFTGEIAADMLLELGVKYVIIGHSERRQYNNETNASVNLKVKKILEKGMTPIMCCGETLAQREAGVTNEFVGIQVKEGLAGLTAEDAKKVVVAYEPIWAIGTGVTATSAQANETIGAIRNTLKEVFGTEAAEAIRIQYGGSMKPSNVAELMAMPEIDGGLIGGASLKAEDFSKVVNF